MTARPLDFDPGRPDLRARAFVRHCPAVLDPTTCAAIIADAEARGFAAAPINGPGGPAMRPDVRNNRRVMYDDPPRAADLFARLAPWLPDRVGPARPIGLNERFRVYRYTAGQRFDWHHDGWFERRPGERSRLTVLFYLSAGYAGGRTEFEGIAVDAGPGDALIFAHGMLHRGAPVESGTKYVLRSDVMYRDDPSA